LGKDEINLVRKKLKWDHEPFKIPQKILKDWKEIGLKGIKEELKWKKYYNKKKSIIERTFSNKFKRVFEIQKQNIIKNLETIATRKSSEKILSSLTKENNTLIGGSADLTGSNNTKTKSQKIIKPGDFKGNYIHYGVREHAMCGIMNGLALHSRLIPYGGTFLIFSDYCKPSIRLSAFMKQRVIYVMSHDSIGLGEDGPTHQPIEQLSSLRSVPNLNVFRPADETETLECWQLALENLSSPSVLALTRQKLAPVRKKFIKENKCSYGAYEISRTNNNVELTIFASGSEVNLAYEASHKLATENIYSKVISVPCQELLEKQTNAYKKNILEETKFKISIEAGATNSWEKFIGQQGLTFGIDDFGKSAPYKNVYKHFGLTSENITKKVKEMLNK
jgi:transketolase